MWHHRVCGWSSATRGSMRCSQKVLRLTVGQATDTICSPSSAEACQRAVQLRLVLRLSTLCRSLNDARSVWALQLSYFSRGGWLRRGQQPTDLLWMSLVRDVHSVQLRSVWVRSIMPYARPPLQMSCHSGALSFTVTAECEPEKTFEVLETAQQDTNYKTSQRRPVTS